MRISPTASRRRLALPAVAATGTLIALLIVGCGSNSGSETSADAQDASSTSSSAPSIDDLLDAGRVLNIAHAGGDRVHPHSTLYGFGESVAKGADMLEMDVQLSADGVVVVIHDLTVDGTTNGTGPVADFTVAELQALDAGWRFCPGCPSSPTDADYPWRGVATGEVAPPEGYGPEDFRIPTLAEVATAFPGLPLDIEIKGTAATGALDTAAALAEELVALGRVESSVVVSFDSEVVQAFHELAPDIEVSPGLVELVDWYFRDGSLAAHYRIIQIPPEYEGIEVLDAAAIDAAAQAGVVVWVWPSSRDQENTATYRSWIELGVDGIIAGDPAAMTAALG
jgi:glycerophosphoryl diester phosphodiesterase